MGVTYDVADNVTYRVAFMMRPTRPCAPPPRVVGRVAALPYTS